MKPHAFIAMPFGKKPGADGQEIDFNAVFRTLLGPALADAGFEVFRADEEQRAGDIRTDMFQELLAADLVLADLTIDNPNVWYELGVRHALRSRGVVLVQGPRSTKPFDIYTDRKYTYALKAGVPDEDRLAADRAAIAAMARETHAASTRRKVSPVYALLPHLEPPRWTALLMGTDNEFGAAYAAWKSRMEVARRKKRAGDILVLAAETPVRALAVEAYLAAGRALLQLWQPAFALEQIDATLAIDPDHLAARQQRVVCLSRLGRYEEAREAAATLLRDHATDPECLALAGRIEKEAWIARFRPADAPMAEPGALKDAAAAEDALLAEAIAPYQRGYTVDPSHFYSGINALTLNVLRAHLEGDHDPALTERLLGGLRWAIGAALEREPKDYWARASAAELALLCFEAAAVQREWKAAAAAASQDWFALDSSRQTLRLLSELGFRPAETALALKIVEAEIARLVPPFVPQQVILFSGHIVDAPDRAKPRFPPAMVPAATAAIAQALDALGAGPGDLALTQGAAGGDLIFTEACLERGVQVQWLQPLPEPEFIEASIMRASDAEAWRARYFAAKGRIAAAATAARLPPADMQRTMPVELGPLPKGVDPWERGNLWLLNTALAHGPDKARCVVLWDGGGGDGPGGTKHMVDEVKRRTGRVSWIDTRRLGGG